MESHEVLRSAVQQLGAKKVAGDVRVSTSLVYKWCQPSTASASAGEISGARNPLDRVKALLESTGDLDPEVSGCRVDAEYIANTQRIIEDFSNLLRVVSEAIADDGKVDPQEASKIRTKWQRLKQYGEGFVCACDRGLFA